MWDKIKDIISPLAPVLGGMLGGPMGAIAGNAIKKALDLPNDATESDILTTIEQATPEQLIALKQLDNELEAIHQRDRDSARNREIKLAETGKPDYVVPSLAYTVTGGFFILAFYILQLVKGGSVTGEEGTLIGLLLGYAAGVLQQVISYFFGSSKGSKEKDKLIEGIKR